MLSAFVAYYRDTPAIPIIYERLDAVFKIGVAREIIFVNDGSPTKAAPSSRSSPVRDLQVAVVTEPPQMSATESAANVADVCTLQLFEDDLADTLALSFREVPM